MTAPVLPERDAPKAQDNEGLRFLAHMVLAAFTGLMLGLALTGCGGGGGDPDDDPADQPPPALDCKARPEVCK